MLGGSSRSNQCRVLGLLIIGASLLVLDVPAAAPLRAAALRSLEPGARTAAHRSGARAVDRRGTPLRVIISRTGLETHEPTLGIGRSGSVFTVAYQSSIVGIDVLRSNDLGRSWEVVSPKLASQVNSHLLSVDPYIYVDELTGRIFTIDLTVACSYMSFSDDGGGSWTTNPLACGRPVNDHQTLFAGPPVSSEVEGYRNVIYYCFNDMLESNCSKSLDGGLTFSSTKAPAYPRSCGGLHGHGVVGPRGEVLLPMAWCGEAYLAISRDEGDTWTRTRVAPGLAHLDPSVAVDSKGNIYYAWQGQNRLAYLAISRDGGKSWSRPMMIAAPGVEGVNLLTLDVGRPGTVGFAYMGTQNASPSRMKWYGYVGVSTNILRGRPLFRTAQVNNSQRPFKNGECGPGRCGEAVLDFIDVVVDDQGFPWAVFVDACVASCEPDQPTEATEGVVAYLRKDSKRP